MTNLNYIYNKFKLLEKKKKELQVKCQVLFFSLIVISRWINLLRINRGASQKSIIILIRF